MGNQIGALLFQNETCNSESGQWAVFHFRPSTSGQRLVGFKGITTEYMAGNQLVKVFKQKTDNDWNSSHRRSSSYIENKEIAQKYLRKYEGNSITFLELHAAEMDRIAVFSRHIRSSNKRHKLRLSEDDVVVFERHLGKHFETFIKRDGTVNGNCCAELQEFVHFVYNESKGQEIVTGLKGVMTKQGQKFKLTSPAMNSVSKKYGPDDLGEKAMLNFFTSHVCTDVCSQWPKPTILHPFDNLETTIKTQNFITATTDMPFRNDDKPPVYDSKWRVDFENSRTFSSQMEPTAPPSYDLIT
ncbi:uncharacterized protein LOC117338093 [Pecten maximus]|uniref:uncharacterized protein LOC117338093 n=1 Tax=Pecten maximus TaxID=6579 RepID=UPI001458D185|nr:uncharacterized protein LOC117338093 [Pecten maximus]